MVKEDEMDEKLEFECKLMSTEQQATHTQPESIAASNFLEQDNEIIETENVAN